jgi:hypothetical protein
VIFDIFNLRDIWHVWILKKHKHIYKRIEDGKAYGISWQMHQCEDCKKIVGLDDWQIRDLPTDMLYEKVQKIIYK